MLRIQSRSLTSSRMKPASPISRCRMRSRAVSAIGNALFALMPWQRSPWTFIAGRRGASMAFPRHRSARAADEKVEIDALVRLLHRVAVKLDPSTLRVRGRRPPRRAAARELVIRNVEMQASRIDIELDHVAGFDERERPACGGFGRRVQHDGAVRGARHPRIGDANHVADALLQDLCGQCEIPDLGKTRVALGPAVLEY